MENVHYSSLNTFFIDHLNKVYCAKSHLIERLPEVLDHVHFEDLHKAITQTINLIECQLADIEKIYIHLNITYSFENCTALINQLDDAFITIQRKGSDKELRDLFALAYLYIIESMELASFQILELISRKIMPSKITSLIKESYKAAKNDTKLLLSLTRLTVSR